MLHKTPLNSPKLACAKVQTKIVIAKGESAATHYYWRERDKNALSNVEPTQRCIITLPHATTTSSSVSGKLLLSSQLSSKAKNATVVLQLESASLISLGKLCDENCNFHLHKKNLKVYKSSKISMQGYRNPHDGLWYIPITSKCIMPPMHPGLCLKLNVKFKPTASSHQERNLKTNHSQSCNQKINVIVRKKQPKTQLAQYLHVTCQSPTVSTFF